MKASRLALALFLLPVTHPISGVPDFHCTQSGPGSETACLSQAQELIRKDLVELDRVHGSKPGLEGPSDYWGRSEFFLPATLSTGKAPLVAVLMHGMYEDGRQLAPVAVSLAQSGIPVLNIVLAGHGSTNEQAGDVVAQDWLEDGERALRLARALGERVLLIGHSTGGMVSIELGLKYPEVIAGVTAIEPAVKMTTLVQTAACVSQHGISNIADHPELLKIYGFDPKNLHNRVLAPSAGCEVHLLRDAALSLISPKGSDDRWGLDDLKSSRALGNALQVPLLIFINRHDLVVDFDNNEAFAEGAALHGFAQTLIFNLDKKMPHGSITFDHPEMIISKLKEFIKDFGGTLTRPGAVETMNRADPLSIRDGISTDQY